MFIFEIVLVASKNHDLKQILLVLLRNKHMIFTWQEYCQGKSAGVFARL